MSSGDQIGGDDGWIKNLDPALQDLSREIQKAQLAIGDLLGYHMNVKVDRSNFHHAFMLQVDPDSPHDVQRVMSYSEQLLLEQNAVRSTFMALGDTYKKHYTALGWDTNELYDPHLPSYNPLQSMEDGRFVHFDAQAGTVRVYVPNETSITYQKYDPEREELEEVRDLSGDEAGALSTLARDAEVAIHQAYEAAMKRLRGIE